MDGAYDEQAADQPFLFLFAAGRPYICGSAVSFPVFWPVKDQDRNFVVVLFFLYQAVMLAVFCVRFLGPLREIEKISEMIAQPERHMADLEGEGPYTV